MGRRDTGRKGRGLRVLCYAGLIGIMLYSAFQLWLFYEEDQRAAAGQRAVLPYKQVKGSEDLKEGIQGNPSICALQEKYPAVIGWLTIPNSRIDYPFVQGDDNVTYLSHDLDGRIQASGTIFMDYRNQPDFSDENTILYGHAMKNGSVFGDIERFRKKELWEGEIEGAVYLPDKTLRLQLLACLLVTADDDVIYNPKIAREQLQEYIQRKAIHLNNQALTEEGQLLTLSTCAYDVEDGRLVLIGLLRGEEGQLNQNKS